jgi:hypothetical protein
MQMIDVIKKLAELDEANLPKPMVQMANDPTVAIIKESITGEAGMPMAAPAMAPSIPASFSINASAANGNEVSTMLRDILNLAGMKEVGPTDINPKDTGAPLTGEPGQDSNADMRSAIDAITSIDQGQTGATMGTAGPAGGQTKDVSKMADEVQDMADELGDTVDLGMTDDDMANAPRDADGNVDLGNPNDETDETDEAASAFTISADDGNISGPGFTPDENGTNLDASDDKEAEQPTPPSDDGDDWQNHAESLRHFDNSPKENTRDYNPNDFANIINKIRKFDYTATPANNNLPESLKQQYVPAEKEDNLLDMTQKLFQEYQGFIKNI